MIKPSITHFDKIRSMF